METVRRLLKKKEALLVLCFFLFWMFLDGPRFSPDSRAYLTLGITREAGYSLFLALCRQLPFASLLQAEGYAGIWYALFFQNLLWAYAVYRVGTFVYDLAGNIGGLPGRAARIMAYCAAGLQLGVCLINRFLANRRSMYPNEILTEGLTMPLFLLVSIQVFYVLREGKRKNLIACALLSFVLITVRNQMQFALITWGMLAVLYLLLLPAYRNVKRGALQVAVILAVVLCNRFADSCYHYAFHGFFGRLDTGASSLVTMLYSANESDAALFREDEQEEREWFLQIARAQEEDGANYDALPADAGAFDVVAHFAEYYDAIQYGMVHPLIIGDPELQAIADNNERIRQMYAREGAMARILFRQDLSDVLRVFIANFQAALVCSVGRVTPRLFPVMPLAYLPYLVLLILCIRKKRKEGEDPGVVLFALIVLCNIVVNSLVVGFLICPSVRYMSYGMGFFYTALPLMLLSLKGKRAGEAAA